MVPLNQKAKYSALVASRLAEVGLTANQVDRVHPKLMQALEFLRNPPPLDSGHFNYRQTVLEAARLLDITAARLISAAVRQDNLFRQPAKVTDEKVTRAAELIGVEKAEYVEAALRTPTLFYRDPEVIAGHARKMDSFAEKKYVPPNVREYYMRNSAMLALGDDNFALREAFAAHTGWRNDTTYALLRTSRSEIQNQFLRALGHDPLQKTVSVPRPTGDFAEAAEGKQALLLIRGLEEGWFKGYTYDPEPEDGMVPA